MKIAIPLFKDSVADSFTATNMIGIYDSDTDKVETSEISELLSKYNERNVIDLFRELGISDVISNLLHPMAMHFFKINDITVYKSEGSLDDCINNVKNGNLTELSAWDMASSGCGTECSSCSGGC